MSKQIEAVNHLTDNFYRNPSWASCTMTRKELRETLEYFSDSDFRVLSCGRLHPIEYESVGPNIYRVTLDYKELDYGD